MKPPPAAAGGDVTGRPAATGLALPRVLNAAHQEALATLWDRLRAVGGGSVDASPVRSLDSAGLALLVAGIESLQRAGIPVTLASPGPALRAARRALRLGERLPVPPEDDEPPPEEWNLRLGEVLVRLGHLSEEKLAEGLALARQRPATLLGTVLLEAGFIREEHLAQALAAQNGLPYVEPVADQVLDVTLDHGVPFPELRVHGVLPFLRLDDVLAVAVQDPSDVYAVDAVRNHSGLAVLVSVATASEIGRGLDLLQRAEAVRGQGAGPLLEESGTPVEERFREMLVNALIEGASDIHIEPTEEHYEIRYRVDGRLRRALTLSRDDGGSLTAFIKVSSGCDISEKRLPQDGRYRYSDQHRDVDLRVNTLPTVYGEKTVLRILDRKAGSVPLELLGLEGRNLEWLREGIHAPHGMVLVTGPTGSGKTTTLYSILDEIVSPEINVSTVENPVERAVEGVNQTQVNPKAGLTFETCLRALLRQDPDVIMIGEIRDRETAQIAVEAALTGHLVLATLHTNDAPGAPVRLIQMGVEPFLVAATLRTVMAQRLVRRLCESCKQPVALPAEVRRKYLDAGLGPGPHYHAVGCPACRGTGYDKRLGIYEVLRADEAICDLVARNPSGLELRHKALEAGMTTLLQDAIRHVNRGATTLEEAIRAAGGEHG